MKQKNGEIKIETSVDESVPDFKSEQEEREYLEKRQQGYDHTGVSLNHSRSEADTSTHQ